MGKQIRNQVCRKDYPIRCCDYVPSAFTQRSGEATWVRLSSQAWSLRLLFSMSKRQMAQQVCKSFWRRGIGEGRHHQWSPSSWSISQRYSHWQVLQWWCLFPSFSWETVSARRKRSSCHKTQDSEGASWKAERRSWGKKTRRRRRSWGSLQGNGQIRMRWDADSCDSQTTEKVIICPSGRFFSYSITLLGYQAHHVYR